MTTNNETNDHSPVPYDVMRELATQLGGRFVEWMDEAPTPAAEAHWQSEQQRVMREARAVDPDDPAAIATHTKSLRTELTAMPRYAPELP